MQTPDWSPFAVAERAPAPRSLRGPHGVGDRLRATAFAELQAREAFAWGAERYPDAPVGCRAAWRGLAAAEDRHLGWLLRRMDELGVVVDARPVTDRLWRSLTTLPDAAAFAWYMAGAELRGQLAGERFAQTLAEGDPVTAAIFGRIAAEEVAHVAVAGTWFPDSCPSGFVLAG